MGPTRSITAVRGGTTARNECGGYAVGDFPFIAPRTMRPPRSTLVLEFPLSVRDSDLDFSVRRGDPRVSRFVPSDNNSKLNAQRA